MFVVPAGLVPVVQAACTDDIARRLRRQLVKDLATGGVGDGDPGGWLTDWGGACCGFLRARGGGASGAQLSEAEPRLRTQLSVSLDKSYGGTFNITSRVLTLLGCGGAPGAGAPARRLVVWAVRVVRGLDVAGRGRAGDGGLEGAAARVELARRWLRSFGPAPVVRPAVVGRLDGRADQGGAGRPAGGRGRAGRAARRRAGGRPLVPG